MKKKILCLMMAAFMIISLPFTVNAAEDHNKEWAVNFDGKKMTTMVGEEVVEQLDLSFSNLLPGESFTMKAVMQNSSKNKTDWYMSNEILQALEESKQSANGAAYTYVLTYHASEDATPVEIYNSSSVGGTTKTSDTEQGLKEVKDLKDYFYLDRLEPSEEAYVCLYVKLGGETHVNSYQDTIAKLQLNFAVEKISEGTTTKEITKEIKKVNTETVVKVVPTMVQTGDNAQVGLFSALTLGSAAVLIVLAVRAMMKRRSEKGELQ